jgi:hypothetical protein
VKTILRTVATRERVGDDPQPVVGKQLDDGTVTDCIDSVVVIGRPAEREHD